MTPLSRAPSAHWLVALAFLILVAHEGHEFVHTAVGRMICGAWGPRDFNVWSLAPGCGSWWPTLAGPVFSWALMWVGVGLLRSTRESRRWIGLALVFAPNPLGRLLPALLGGGDEGVVARALISAGPPWPRIAVIIISGLIILPALAIAWRSLPVHHRPWWFLGLFAAGILVTGPLLLLLGNTLLGRGVLASTGLVGAPMLVDLFTTLSLLGLLTTGRWLTNER